MTTATVIKHWKDRDYCFVATDDGREAHMHASACRADFDKLVQGAQLDCELVAKGDGRWSAKKATLVCLPAAEDATSSVSSGVHRMTGLIQRRDHNPKKGFVAFRHSVSSAWYLSPDDAREALVDIAEAAGCNAILSMESRTRRANQGGNYYRTEHCYTADICVVYQTEPSDIDAWKAQNSEMLAELREAVEQAETIYGGASRIWYNLKGVGRFIASVVTGKTPSPESVRSVVTVGVGCACAFLLMQLVIQSVS